MNIHPAASGWIFSHLNTSEDKPLPGKPSEKKSCDVALTF